MAPPRRLVEREGEARHQAHFAATRSCHRSRSCSPEEQPQSTPIAQTITGIRRNGAIGSPAFRRRVAPLVRALPHRAREAGLSPPCGELPPRRPAVRFREGASRARRPCPRCVCEPPANGACRRSSVGVSLDHHEGVRTWRERHARATPSRSTRPAGAIIAFEGRHLAVIGIRSFWPSTHRNPRDHAYRPGSRPCRSRNDSSRRPATSRSPLLAYSARYVSAPLR